jgi:arginine exporter protein ArgO
MGYYTILGALAGIVIGILIAVRTKKAEGLTYNKLDKLGRVTNILLIFVYTLFSPVYLLLGALSEPSCDGFLWIIAAILGTISASAAIFCSLGLGFSVALRKKGKSKLSFIVQFAGAAGIALTIVIYGLFAGTLLTTIN